MDVEDVAAGEDSIDICLHMFVDLGSPASSLRDADLVEKVVVGDQADGKKQRINFETLFGPGDRGHSFIDLGDLDRLEFPFADHLGNGVGEI